MSRSMKADRTAGKKPWGWILPIMTLAVSLGLSYGAYRLASYSWDQVASYKSPYTGLSGVDFSGARPALTDQIPDSTPRRVVMVVIDGLRDDASRSMKSIERLRESGADVRLTVGQPSLSYPTWTTIVSGAPQQISGVTTNWFEGPVKVETLFDVAASSGRRVVVSGPEDLEEMFGVSKVATSTALVPWDADKYTSGTIVDNALRLDEQEGGADFVFVLLPDVDEAGHAAGGASARYAETVARVDKDLGRLIQGLDDGATTFVVLPDHGHTDTGGHGGWEDPVIHTFAVLSGPGVAKTTAEADLQDIAPTVAVIAGLQAPLQGTGTAIDSVLADSNGRSRDADFVRSAGITLSYVRKVLGDGGLRAIGNIESPADLPGIRAKADAQRLAEERKSRTAVLAGVIFAAAVLLAVIGIASWRALVAALIGTVVYSAAYNALFFGVHRLSWSLSAFNDEAALQGFFNMRMAEAAASGLLACVAGALVYSTLMKRSSDARPDRALDWIALGGAVVLVTQAVLVLQVAAYVWQWGISVTWLLPDMREAFKYDLDLIQLTALGAAALIGPLAAWAIGRLRPRTLRVSQGD